MKVAFNEYTVEIVDVSDFTQNSNGSTTGYDKVYFDEKYQPTSKHSITIVKDGQRVVSALIGEAGVGTGVHDNAFVIFDSKLFICCSDTAYSFELPSLILNWKKELDSATCFAIYPFKNDLIIHGEIEIRRVDLQGAVKWSFSARDIFVTPDGRDAFTIKGDTIELLDWTGHKYLLDENGQLLMERFQSERN